MDIIGDISEYPLHPIEKEIHKQDQKETIRRRNHKSILNLKNANVLETQMDKEVKMG